jgi:hypothetical protein
LSSPDSAGAPGAAQPWPPIRTQRYTLFVLTVVIMFTVLDVSPA